MYLPVNEILVPSVEFPPAQRHVLKRFEMMGSQRKVDDVD
jgi:hypothetical protein